MLCLFGNSFILTIHDPAITYQSKDRCGEKLKHNNQLKVRMKVAGNGVFTAASFGSACVSLLF
jgi:hypothetical protein